MGYSNVDCGVHNRINFAYKVSEEALWMEIWYSGRVLNEMIVF